jgi:hypothetical protein
MKEIKQRKLSEKSNNDKKRFKLFWESLEYFIQNQETMTI